MLGQACIGHFGVLGVRRQDSHDSGEEGAMDLAHDGGV